LVGYKQKPVDMNSSKEKLITAIRSAADSILKGENYQWGHMGSCNCGHLAQQLTEKSKEEIHRYAMEKHGDWAEQVLDFCPTSGMSMDWLISELTSCGLTTRDLIDLERLTNEEVLKKAGVTHLEKNKKEDVVLYMETWASCLEIV
jgi:hypothetical protein